jgi:hypothetical protein
MAQLGGLLYFPYVCSYFVSREEIGDIIEHHIQCKLDELPIELSEMIPHVPRLLESKHGGIFPYPARANKCMYFSFCADRINLVLHKLSLPHRVELCSIVILAMNGMDLPWEILTRWAKSPLALPITNLFMALVEDATVTNHGTICSSLSFRQSQPFENTTAMALS